MKNVNWKEELKNFALVTVGSIIYAAALSFLLEPHKIAPGGVAGIALILANYINIEYGTLLFALNIPLLIAAFIRFRGRFLTYTLYSLAFSSLLMNLFNRWFPSYIPCTQGRLLCALTGGAIMAAGISLVMLGGGCTGGFDIVIKFLRQRFVHLKTGSMFLIIDFILTVITCIVFRDLELALYGLVTLFVNGVAVDMVIYGGNEAKMIFVVSDSAEEIARRLMHDVKVGVTLFEAEGAYTGARKKVVMSTFRKQIYFEVREVVKNVDPRAFLIVASASEIFGEGFKDHFEDEI